MISLHYVKERQKLPSAPLAMNFMNRNYPAPMPASSITLPILAISGVIVAAKRSGELPRVCAPASRNLFFHFRPG